MSKRVLSVGNCGFDGAAISRLVTKEFGATIDAVDDADQAIASAKSTRYDLILVNRVFDATGGSGLELLKALKTDPETKDAAAILITNYPEVQREAESLGAAPGFGKRDLNSPETRARLAVWLD